VHVAGQQLVVKRYNLKSPAHALSRLLRPSRAWHSWQAAIRLRFAGVATPQPLAMTEERWGPLRRRAWLLTDYCSGAYLSQLLCASEAPPAAIGQAIINTFNALHEAQITHGDLKATNLLWDGKELLLIDLDATMAHGSRSDFKRSWKRDRTRLLRNWPEDSALAGWLDRNLPKA
jgi:tRNA A-37 threonylcarbamoyl transferase component Bud32